MSWVEVKHALNSTLGTGSFLPIDKLTQKSFMGDRVIITESMTWQKPAGISFVRITACGAGAGGEARPGGSVVGGYGGGAGEYIFRKLYDISALTELQITIGKGGTGGGDMGSPAPQNGGQTVISGIITLDGGLVRGGGSGAGQDGTGTGKGGSPAVKNVILGESMEGAPGGRYGGGGGDGCIGHGGDGVSGQSTTSGNKGGYGAGGGGTSGYNSSKVRRGGAGGDGIVIIEYGLEQMFPNNMLNCV